MSDFQFFINGKAEHRIDFPFNATKNLQKIFYIDIDLNSLYSFASKADLRFLNLEGIETLNASTIRPLLSIGPEHWGDTLDRVSHRWDVIIFPSKRSRILNHAQTLPSSRLSFYVHSEARLATHLALNPPRESCHEYIGLSRRCCPVCAAYVKVLNSKYPNKSYFRRKCRSKFVPWMFPSRFIPDSAQRQEVITATWTFLAFFLTKLLLSHYDCEFLTY